jgi:PAS domain S-box-containing protein
LDAWSILQFENKLIFYIPAWTRRQARIGVTICVRWVIIKYAVPYQDGAERGIDNLDPEEGAFLWRPLSLARIAQRALHESSARFLLLAWALLTVACIILGVYQAEHDWNGLPVQIGPVQFFFTIYPPLILCILMLFWLGLSWAALSAYAATLCLALYTGMPAHWAVLFALADPIALAVYAVAYRVAAISFDLRSGKSLGWFVAVSFLAAVATSPGAFIWSTLRSMSEPAIFATWQGWWIGAFAQAMLVDAPILALFGRRLELLKLRFFDAPARPVPSPQSASTAIAVGGFVLAGFILATGELASTRLSVALAQGVSSSARGALLAAAQSWRITVWIGMILVVAGSATGVFLAHYWTRRLYQEVRLRTAELEESERRFRATFEQAAVGIAHVTLDGRWLRVNQNLCDILGYTREDLLRTGFLDLIFVSENEAGKQQMSQLMNGSIPMYAKEKHCARKGGMLVWMQVNLSVARGPQGEARYFICILENIENRKRLEEQLRQSQKMETVGRLAGGVAHDFNNLLTVISGYARMLFTEIREDGPQKHHVKEIVEASERAAALTRQLLSFSRRQVMQPEILVLDELVGGMERMLRRLIGEDILLETRLGSSPARVKADRGQIEQVVVNLVVNARDAMPHGGNLTVETTRVERNQTPQVMLAVRDTGIGMSAEVQSHIFEPFFTTKELGKGTGLGLSTVYGIIKQSAGDIVVHSRPGLGTVFEIYLPNDDSPWRGPQPATVPSRPERGLETILLVEDEEPVRRLVNEILRQNGYTVLEAGNGDEAVNLLRQHVNEIHLMVTDVIMPGIRGDEVAQRLAQLRPETPVLYISGYAENALDLQSALGPQAAFLQKPFTPSALAHKVRELLDSNLST